jgi:hypothetical protein
MIDSASAMAILTEIETALERVRYDLRKALENRFCSAGEPADDDDVVAVIDALTAPVRAAEDIRHILADAFDWPMTRALRQARRAPR